MESNRFNRYRQKTKSFNIKKNNKLIVYLICVAIASTLWFLNALSERYTTTISYPVKFTNLPSNKILISSPPKKLKLEVNAYGFTLLRNSLSMAFRPLIFDLKTLSYQRKELQGSSVLQIATNRHLGMLQGQVSSEIKIISAKPDSLFFKFDPLIDKKVSITPHLTVNLQTQFIQTDSIKLSPDSVLILGPKSILDTLSTIDLPNLAFDDVNKTIIRNISLPDIEHIRYQKKRTLVTVPIEEYTEEQISVPVRVINSPDSINILTFPAKININYLVTLENNKKIDISQFDITADYLELDPNKLKVELKMNHSPENIISYNLELNEVEYLKEKQDD